MERIFLSHAGPDSAISEVVYDRLSGAGYEVFFDRSPDHGMVFGEDWEQRIYREMHRADAMLCVVTSAYLESKWCAYELVLAKASGRRLLPLRCEAGVKAPKLDRYHRIEFDDDGRWLRAVAVALDPSTAAVDLPPYPGLRAFQRKAAPMFRGRSEESLEAAGRLRSLGDRARDRLLLVSGQSGCGKSSFVRAGVAAVLAADPGWLVAEPFTPGTHPVAAAVTALAATARQVRASLTAAEIAALLNGADGFTAVAQRLLDSGERLLLIIDQGEELLRADETERDQLTALVRAALRGPVSVVLAARSEFQDQLIALIEVEPGVFPLRPLTRDMLRVVITEPAKAAGLKLEEALVRKLVEDTGSGEALPLLAFTLERLADGRAPGDTLTLESYLDPEIGGVQKALVHYADKALVEARNASGLTKEQVLAGLVRLVRAELMEEEPRVVRARVDLDALDPQLRRALDVFVEAKLLTTAGDGDARWAELVHEALFTAWPPLAAMVTTSLQALHTARRVEIAAREWVSGRRQPRLLWTSDQLSAAEFALGDPRAVMLSEPADQFLTATQDRVRSEKRRRAWRFIVAFTALSALTLASAAAAALALSQWRDAERQRVVAGGHSLLSQAAATRDTEAGTALRLGIAAMAVHPSPEARAGLMTTLLGNHYAGTLDGHRVAVSAVAFSPSGPIAVTGGGEPPLVIWDVADPAHPERLAVPAEIEGEVWAIVFSSDGRMMATAGTTGLVTLWDMTAPARPRVLATLAGGLNWTSSLALSPDNRTLLVATWDNASDRNKATVWDVSDPARPKLRSTLVGGPGRTGPVRAVALGNGGRTAITGSEDGVVRLWDIAEPATPRPLATLTDHGNSIWATATARGGDLLITGGADRTALLWDITDPAHPIRLSTLTGHTGTVRAAAFSPDGQTVITGSEDHTAILWRVTDPRHPALLKTLGGHREPVFSVAFDRDGRRSATGSADHNSVLWNLVGDAAPIRSADLAGHSKSIFGSAFDPTGQILATGGDDNTTILWDVAARRRLATLTGTFAYAFGPKGRTLLTGSRDGIAALWDVTDPTRPNRLSVLPEHRGTITAAAVDPTGRLVALGNEDGSMGLWDITRPTQPVRRATVGNHRYMVSAVPFTPDGRAVVTASTDQTAVIWDITDPAQPRPIGEIQDTNSFYFAAFSPDGRVLALAQEGRKATLWDLTDRSRPRHLTTMHGQSSSVYAISYSPDGRLIATGGYDKTAILWDVTDPTRPRQITTLAGNPASVRTIAFSPDRHTLAVSTGDTPVVWDIGAITEIVADPVTVACRTAGRELSTREWAELAPDLPYRTICPSR
ncbi:nSTAND1 domain-containing NTPase [Nocardia amamiensis]|uniref:nSTAND1 domain-containing NTPase n=1 Tax=Nocardia amamiensis TaxID=404578 RepID=UPI0033D445EE